MKTFNDLKDGDSIWLRIQYETTYRTKEVRQAMVRHVVQDDDLVSQLTGIRRNWIRIIEFDGASRIHYKPEKGDTCVFKTLGMSGTHLTYYTDKSRLIVDLENEKMRLQEEVDALIEQLKSKHIC